MLVAGRKVNAPVGIETGTNDELYAVH
jgi:hypothetical protein